MNSVRIAQVGAIHPHSELYRATIASHPAFELVGGYDPDPDRAAHLLARENLELPLFASVDETIAELHPDAVLITLPNDVTPDAIVAAAGNGLPMLAEKPAAVSAAAFLPAHAALRKAGVPFIPAYLRRFSPVANTMRDLVAEGVIGELVSAQINHATANVALRNATYLAGGAIEHATAGQPDGDQPLNTNSGSQRAWLFDRARAGGGIMHWLGVHWLDLLRLTSGQEFTHVTASLATRSKQDIDVEDVAAVTLESDGGMIANVSCAYVLGGGPDQIGIALHGDRGWMRLAGAELHVHSDQPAWRAAPERTLRFESPAMPGYSGALGWEIFDRFRAAIREQRELPVGPDDALRVLELLDAIHRSSDEGRRVAVEVSRQ